MRSLLLFDAHRLTVIVLTAKQQKARKRYINTRMMDIIEPEMLTCLPAGRNKFSMTCYMV